MSPRLTLSGIFLLTSIFFTAHADEQGDTVLLQYSGAAGSKAVGEVYADTIKIENGKETVEMTMEGSLKLHATEHADGTLYRQFDNNISVNTDMDQMQGFMRPIIEAYSNMEMRSVVSPEGEILTLEGLDEAISATQEALKGLAEDVPEEAKPYFDMVLNNAVSEETLLNQAKETWFHQVGMWIGAEFEKGYVYSSEYVEAVPAFGNLELQFDATYEYLGKVACNKGTEALNCVELAFNSVLHADHAKKLTEAIAEQLKLPLPEDFIMSIEQEIFIIAEPSTLKTHRFGEIKTVSAPNDDQSGWSQKVDRMFIDYTYE